VGETVVRYFAADFFMERGRYLMGEVNEANIWMVGYALRVNPYEGMRIKVDDKELPFKEVSVENAEVLLSYEKGGTLDEYVVSGKVKRIEKMAVLGEEVLIVGVESRPLGTIDVLVNSSNIGGELKVGDMVEAIGWMEGKISGEKWKTLE